MVQEEEVMVQSSYRSRLVEVKIPQQSDESDGRRTEAENDQYERQCIERRASLPGYLLTPSLAIHLPAHVQKEGAIAAATLLPRIGAHQVGDNSTSTRNPVTGRHNDPRLLHHADDLSIARTTLARMGLLLLQLTQDRPALLVYTKDSPVTAGHFITKRPRITGDRAMPKSCHPRDSLLERPHISKVRNILINLDLSRTCAPYCSKQGCMEMPTGPGRTGIYRTNHRTASRSTCPNRRSDIERNLGQGHLVRCQTPTYLANSRAAGGPLSAIHLSDLAQAQPTRALKADQSRR